ncbi:DUF4340 domain-containing protein [Leptolyngbya sp. FACHB-711]|uniref:DUF4340 domain-containing protein n=1 Tax=unclassified Leptolyngbya TaxID=2650499 RepID=UPI0018EF93DC|nr:DUF4340 domain-containing protein [Leptolyngbya sp. FACHB-711]
MKIKPSTFLLLLTALLLGGVTLVAVQNQPQNQSQGQQASQSEPSDLFAFTEKQVKTLSLTTPLRSLKFERDAEGIWQMQQPEQTPASAASIAFLLDLMTSGTSDRTFTVPAAQREQYGFHQPFAAIEVTLDNQETHRLIVGEYDFNRSFLYALADPSTDANADLKVSLVSPSFENAVNRPLAEWKQTAAEKQAAPAASPSPSPGASSPSPEASPKPSPDPSPDASPSSASSPSPEASPASPAAPSPSPNSSPSSP